MVVAVTIPTHATFPGKNRCIVFVLGPDIYTMNPDDRDVQQITDLVYGNSAGLCGEVTEEDGP
jgi:hypothetical protein